MPDNFEKTETHENTGQPGSSTSHNLLTPSRLHRGGGDHTPRPEAQMAKRSGAFGTLGYRGNVSHYTETVEPSDTEHAWVKDQGDWMRDGPGKQDTLDVLISLEAPAELPPVPQDLRYHPVISRLVNNPVAWKRKLEECRLKVAGVRPGLQPQHHDTADYTIEELDNITFNIDNLYYLRDERASGLNDTDLVTNMTNTNSTYISINSNLEEILSYANSSPNDLKIVINTFLNKLGIEN